MRTFKIQYQNGDTCYCLLVRQNPNSIILELDDKHNYVFSRDGYLIHSENETDLMMISRQDLTRLDEMMMVQP